MVHLELPRAITQPRAPAVSFRVEPYDIDLLSDEESLTTLQLRKAAFLRGLSGPCRILALHRPTNLDPLIARTLEQAQQARDPQRRERLMEYRRFYENLQATASYQSASCALLVWPGEGEHPGAVALGAAGAFGTRVYPGHLPPLLAGRYTLRNAPHFWHLAPAGRPGGRPYACFLSSYALKPVAWNFFQPLGSLLDLGIPLAVAVDVPRTLDPHEARTRVENVLIAYRTHLSLASGKDSAGEKRYQDCEETLRELNRGEALHELQIVVALFGEDTHALKARRDQVRSLLKPYLGVRHEVGAHQLRAAEFFSSKPTRAIGRVSTPYPVTSVAAALTLGFLGKRKLESLAGVMRGESVHGRYPLLHDSWQDRRAVHECWVGISGAGKTFALNCYLAREYAHHRIAFDLLEPMGHGQLLGQAFGIAPFVMDPRETCLNPHDVMYAEMGDQVAHVIRLYETVLQRPLGAGQHGNLERAGLARALERFYRGLGRPLPEVTNDMVPLVEDVCDYLHTLDGQAHRRRIYRDLADEIAGLCTGSGPFGAALNGRTTVDFGALRGSRPRIFSFHRLQEDPILVALAYTQTLAALMRDAMDDDSPRVIAVDEVYRMMRHPSLLRFLILAAKTLRTHRKKLIVIDQQMRVFLEGEARLIFENCPIRVIFSQRGGLNVFYEDKAFEHLTDNHRQIIRGLQRFQFLFDVMDEGVWYLHNRPSVAELLRYGKS